jgi:hypothetical protein
MSNGSPAASCFVERAFHPTFEPAVNGGLFVHAWASDAVAVDAMNEFNRSLAQRTGLVGAEYVHGAEVMDRDS